MSNFTEFYGSSIFHFTSFFMTKELTGVSFHHSNKNKLGLVRRDEQKPRQKIHAKSNNILPKVRITTLTRYWLKHTVIQHILSTTELYLKIKEIKNNVNFYKSSLKNYNIYNYLITTVDPKIILIRIKKKFSKRYLGATKTSTYRRRWAELNEMWTKYILV